MTTEETTPKTDFLEVDDIIPGQNYVCLSFVSPEALIQKRDAFNLSKFLQSYCKDQDLNYKEIYSKYEDFVYKHSDKLQRDFDEQNEFKTSVRGLKVRGTYSTKEEAVSRAKKLQTIDSSFHVFVGEVGKWLPWDPNADEVQDEVFQNSQLNDMMEKYQENNINRDIFYEEQKRDKIKAAREEVLRKKREEQQQKALEASEPEPETEPETEPEPVEEVVEVHTLDEDMKDSLESVDPWLANKIKNSTVTEPEPEPVTEPEPEVTTEPEPEPVTEPEPVVTEPDDC